MQWRIVFFVAAGVFLVGNLIFVLFGSATIQPMNDIAEDEVDSSENSMKYESQSNEHFFECFLYGYRWQRRYSGNAGGCRAGKRTLEIQPRFIKGKYGRFSE